MRCKTLSFFALSIQRLPLRVHQYVSGAHYRFNKSKPELAHICSTSLSPRDGCYVLYANETTHTRIRLHTFSVNPHFCHHPVTLGIFERRSIVTLEFIYAKTIEYWPLCFHLGFPEAINKIRNRKMISSTSRWKDCMQWWNNVMNQMHSSNQNGSSFGISQL